MQDQYMPWFLFPTKIYPVQDEKRSFYANTTTGYHSKRVYVG